jgi:hypothetical protein
VHHYAPGVYVREMHVPPWTVLTGAVHKTEHLAMLIQGRIEVLTEDGLQVLEAPCTILSRPGIKRVGRTFEEGAMEHDPRKPGRLPRHGRHRRAPVHHPK